MNAFFIIPTSVKKTAADAVLDAPADGEADRGAAAARGPAPERRHGDRRLASGLSRRPAGHQGEAEGRSAGPPVRDDHRERDDGDRPRPEVRSSAPAWSSSRSPRPTSSRSSPRPRSSWPARPRRPAGTKVATHDDAPSCVRLPFVLQEYPRRVAVSCIMPSGVSESFPPEVLPG